MWKDPRECRSQVGTKLSGLRSGGGTVTSLYCRDGWMDGQSEAWLDEVMREKCYFKGSIRIEKMLNGFYRGTEFVCGERRNTECCLPTYSF